MKKCFLILLSICFCAISAQGQFKMNSNGKMYLGAPYTGNPPGSGQQDIGNVLSGSIFGPNGVWKGGAKLAFGDFGQKSYYGWNVFIGEYPDANGQFTGESDQLWLHGKNGFYITKNGQGTSVVMYHSTLLSHAVYFTTEIFTPSTLTSSDARFKSNITPIESPLNNLMGLRGVAYDFNDKERKDALAARQGEVISEPSDEPPSEKELQAMAEMQMWEEMQLQKEHKLGFIAQEVQEIFPDLVKEDDLGYLAVDYNGIIPVIVEAMKEQQNMIDKQNRRIEALEALLAELGGGVIPPKSSAPAVIEEPGNTTTNASLYQNVPNPFNQQTEIRFFLPEQVRSAAIYIYDMQGKQIKNIPISQRGDARIIISASELKAGTYLYSLVVDQKEIGTLKMILTK